MTDSLKILFSYFLLALLYYGCAVSKDNTVPILIDADTANEVDDLYALVYAIQEPKFNLIGITSAQFHTSPLATESTVVESQNINEDILRLLGRNDIPTRVGSNIPMQSMDKPAESEAMDFIIAKAHEASEENKLQLVILGSCTNIASAIVKDPSIIPKVQVNYLGFWHEQATNTYDKKEFNSGNDTLAVNILLNTEGLDLTVMTATTSQHLVFEKKMVDKQLKGKGGIADYLVDRWDTYNRWWTKEDPDKTRWTMWDVAILQAIAHPEMATKRKFLTPQENTKRYIDIYTDIDVPQMIDNFWESLKDLK